MNKLESQSASLWLTLEQSWQWLMYNSLSIAVALCAGALIVALLLAVRAFGKWLCKGDQHPILRIVIGRVIAITQLWFMAALAAEVVADLTSPPQGLARTIHFAFTIAVALQGAIWIRELILGWVEQRAQQSAEDHGSLVSALGIIRLLVSIAAFAFAAVLILDNLGVNVTALVAGLGIGGIAIGLAAQGIFSDLFAALSILFDKPFRKGDTISWDTSTGTVEAIGLKTTRVRSVTGERLVISNANLLGKELRNLERLDRRRVTFKLALVYQTPPDTLEKIPEILRGVVDGQKKCHFVASSFTGFGASSLDFELIFDVVSRNANDLNDLRTKIGIAILRTFADQGIAIAYPTQTTFTAAPDGTMIMPYAEQEPIKAKVSAP